MYPGTDLIEVERVATAILRRPAIKQRLFTPREIAECEGKGNPIASFAGRFAAKEAVLKSLGTGLRGVKWVEIEIIGDSLGRPEVQLYGAALKLAKELRITTIRVSISHISKLALAFAVALTGEEK